MFSLFFQVDVGHIDLEPEENKIDPNSEISQDDWKIDSRRRLEQKLYTVGTSPENFKELSAIHVNIFVGIELFVLLFVELATQH